MDTFVQRLISFFAGRRTRWVTLLIWLALAVIAATALPSVTAVESQNPANLPSSASSVIAGKIQSQTFHSGTRTPGFLVFYRAGGLSPTDLRSIKASLTHLDQHPLPLQKGKVPFANIPASVLESLAQGQHSTLVVPLTFANSSNSKILAAISRDLGHTLRQATGHNLLTVPLASGHLVARLTGPQGIAIDTSGLFSNADVTLLATTTMLILVLLLLIYRSPILPWIPLVSVGLSYLVTSAILTLLVRAHAIVVDAQTVSIMTVLMFGAGTDYTLFVVSRYRSELWQESDPIRALKNAYQHVSAAVAMSAGTVILALLTLLVSVYGSDHRFAIPFAIGVGMTALASLTLVPALLSLLGRPAFWPYTPKPEKPRPRPRGTIASLVTRRPWAVLLVVTAVLAILAANSFHVRSTSNLLSELPSNAQSVQGYHLLARAEGAGALSPVSVVIEGPDASHNIRTDLARLKTVKAVTGPTLGQYQSHSVAIYSVTLRQNPLSNAAMADLPGIRRAAEQAVSSSTEVYLGGATAQNADSTQAVAHDTRWVIPLVLIIIFVLLLAYLRSVVAAIYLIATVILSFFAALGAGWVLLHNVLGISGWADGVTLYAFVFLVALGEDYNIFMLSSIWRRRRQQPMRESIQWGIQQSGPVISAAGLILAGTFAVLTGLPLRILLEFGSVAAIGVLLDTFLVRSLLVPAITALLQDRALWPSRPPVLPPAGDVQSNNNA